ncbi:MAG: winged helix-turn-helix transcriptional regulator [Alphaproteobacteria bacterium]
MATIEAALRACQAGDCQPQDVAVVAYIVSAIDRSTGECARHYATIADGCGMSRSAVGRSIKRLVDAGVIERARRFARNKAQIATAFTIGGPILDAIAQRTSRPPRAIGGTPPSHQRDAKLSSRDSLYPDGRGPAKVARQGEEEADWRVHADWLVGAGQYAKRWGYGAEALARDDLDRWRREKGDKAILKAIARAGCSGLHGERLWDFLENTWPMRNGGDYGDRREGTEQAGGQATAPGCDDAQDGRRAGLDGGRSRAAG